MEKSALSSKLILILANNLALSHSLKNELQKEAGIVDIAPNLHQAVIHTILKEPDVVFIETGPENFSLLQLIETLKKLKGIKKSPRFVLYADKAVESHFRQKTDGILFFDSRESIPITRQIKRVLEGPASPIDEIGAPWIQYKEREVAYPVSQKEQSILEKLGQLGILKKT
jgi:hypothetical protein